ncbi:hypothetical protein QLH51_12835 [Sphingomonas sp. 2R-10]|uniref:hypothetical protein n=1 Tax=Sphingomonas sp. 2R-10 TaxID=3045148 RepID=UPI000F7ACD3B|nr:hypothetical protein [Sphingomonas sp. 2R-10]MDJ0277683.1 hypothetical protein [Sphingomonas sp. 2R-10]
MTRETLNIGPAPAEEPCAQLGITDLFEQANLLEILCYRAALTACHGKPPEGAAFHIERNVHDFGTYRELAVGYDADYEAAAAWAYRLEDGLARWLDADFLAPVIYDRRSQVEEFACTDHFDAARRAMLLMERLRIDGYGTVGQAIRIAHLRAAYPTQAEEVDQLLRQLADEARVRSPADRHVGLYAPYRLTFIPAMFNDRRGIHYPKGDVIDVHAHEVRAGHCRYVGLGSVGTPDDALALCWEHLARYVIT